MHAAALASAVTATVGASGGRRSSRPAPKHESIRRLMLQAQFLQAHVLIKLAEAPWILACCGHGNRNGRSGRSRPLTREAPPFSAKQSAARGCKRCERRPVRVSAVAEVAPLTRDTSSPKSSK